ncbi:MAG: hypothetical protein MRQ13_02590 [Candidatus Midichloria sp.]|nr:hypothetical protein [Candidatus Midichloria sp.]
MEKLLQAFAASDIQSLTELLILMWFSITPSPQHDIEIDCNDVVPPEQPFYLYNVFIARERHGKLILYAAYSLILGLD